jgi:hypothetical protein
MATELRDLRAKITVESDAMLDTAQYAAAMLAIARRLGL